MSKIIQVENLSKKYIIGHQQLKGKKTFREAINQSISNFGSKFTHAFSKSISSNSPNEEFWALKDINFEVEQGDRIGIIGRNGAGKSTLLKVLSRITEPTSGKITIRGRVASLLEVGTGFNGELTGRENIFLNGAILGMHRAEIKRKFDEIVEFSGVEKFLDTPVKRYSSGMYVRLAFAVAAHLEPEILVIDEVLAVGDAEFQKKCLGKMQDVSNDEGRTVIFVSHNMGAIQGLCSRTIVLGSGEILFNGGVNQGVNYYLNDFEKFIKSIDLSNVKRSGTCDLIVTNFHIEDTYGTPLISALSGNTIVLVFTYAKRTASKVDKVSLGFSIHNSYGDLITLLYSDFNETYFDIQESKGAIKCRINSLMLSAGRYIIGSRIISRGIEIDYPRQKIGYFDVENGDFYGTGSNKHSGLGPVLIKGEWLHVEKIFDK
jgi:lipopolysaccharide transport system ATP-binding protein